jgi:hypothetical protein
VQDCEGECALALGWMDESMLSCTFLGAVVMGKACLRKGKNILEWNGLETSSANLKGRPVVMNYKDSDHWCSCWCYSICLLVLKVIL